MHRGMGTKKALGLLAVMMAFALVLTACQSEGTVHFTDEGVGTVKAWRTGLKAANFFDQTVVEYGLVYSTNKASVANVIPSGSESAWIGSPGSVSLPSGVPGVRVACWIPKSKNATGDIDPIVLQLSQGEKYYFRWYGISLDDTADQVHWHSASSVTSHITLSHDATLKSIKTSKSKLTRKFSKSRYSYRVYLPASTKSTTITVAPTRGASTVKMRVGGATTTALSRKISVSKGKSKTVYIEVKATDGTSVKTYMVKVTRRS